MFAPFLLSLLSLCPGLWEEDGHTGQAARAVAPEKGGEACQPFVRGGGMALALRHGVDVSGRGGFLARLGRRALWDRGVGGQEVDEDDEQSDEEDDETPTGPKIVRPTTVEKKLGDRRPTNGKAALAQLVTSRRRRGGTGDLKSLSGRGPRAGRLSGKP